MLPVAVPDYVRFGPINGLRLFHELTLYPSLERLIHTPVPTLAVIGGRDPLMAKASRVRAVARLSPEHLAVALIEKAAHALNFSHPEELAAKIYVFTLQHTMAEMIDIGRTFKVPVGVAVTPSDLLEAASLAERDFWDDVETSDGTARVPGRPFAGLGWRHLDRLHEPGGDTNAVVNEWLEGRVS